jgi:tripartite-type tricarboxylate transporter receptor subunit TctC
MTRCVPGAAQHGVMRCRHGTVTKSEFGIWNGPGSAVRRSASAARCTASGTRRFAFVALVAAALLGGPKPAAADPVADFYRGKSINLILSAGAGGGYNVVQNMPGAGGIRAMIYFQSVAPQDGTALGFVHSSVPMAPLYGIKGAKFDPREMQWLGSLNASPAICVLWHGSPIKNAKDVFEKEFSVGGTGAGSAMETIPAVLNKFFGTKIRIVSGYKGGNEIYLAMERGEVDGRCAGLVSSIRSTRPDWFPQNKVVVPIVVGFKRMALFPDAPAVAEFAKDEVSKQVLSLMLVPQEMDRPFLAPPGVPAERVAALRKAFHAAFQDPGFQAEAERTGLEINYVAGEAMAKILNDAYALPADVVRAAGEAMNLSGSAK